MDALKAGLDIVPKFVAIAGTLCYYERTSVCAETRLALGRDRLLGLPLHSQSVAPCDPVRSDSRLIRVGPPPFPTRVIALSIRRFGAPGLRRT